MSNSVDPDETAQRAVSSGSMQFAKAFYYSYLDLCSLQKPIIIACGSERVKISMQNFRQKYHYLFKQNENKRCVFLNYTLFK